MILTSSKNWRLALVCIDIVLFGYKDSLTVFFLPLRNISGVHCYSVADTIADETPTIQ